MNRIPSIREVTSNAFAFLVASAICTLLVLILIAAFLWWDRADSAKPGPKSEHYHHDGDQGPDGSAGQPGVTFEALRGKLGTSRESCLSPQLQPFSSIAALHCSQASRENLTATSAWPVASLASRFGILQGRKQEQFSGSGFGHSQMDRDVPAHVFWRRDIRSSLLLEVADQQANAPDDVICGHAP